MCQAIELIHAVRAADDQVLQAFQFKDLPVFCKQKIRVVLFVPDKPAFPFFQLILRQRGWAGFVIAIRTFFP